MMKSRLPSHCELPSGHSRMPHNPPFGGTMAAPPEPTKSMTVCDPRLTFTALDLADAKQPGARHEQPNYRQTQLRNECGPPLHELRR